MKIIEHYLIQYDKVEVAKLLNRSRLPQKQSVRASRVPTVLNSRHLLLFPDRFIKVAEQSLSV